MSAARLDRQGVIVQMTTAHDDQLDQLWRETDGVSVRSADSRESTATYLFRNPSTCFVVIEAGAVSGGVMCGHDGRRGDLLLLSFVLGPAESHLFRMLFLSCVMVAGLYGAWSVSRRIFSLQALPAILALIADVLAQNS